MAARKTKSRRNISTTDPATAYALAVVSGEHVEGPHVRAACKRHLDDLKNGPKRGLRWNIEAAQHAMDFFLDVLTVEQDGEVVPFVLLPEWEFVIGSIFGWQWRNGDKWFRRFNQAYIEAGKGPLALDTPIATPAGWTTMGEIKPGDEVFDERGRPTGVLDVTEIFRGRSCWRVTFDDGQSIVADGSHKWLTEARCAGKPGDAMRGVPKKQWGKWRVARRSTDEIRRTLRYPNGKYQSANHSVKLCGPLRTDYAKLPIRPYVLGVWLGDGDSDCARITCSDADAEILEYLRLEGARAGARKAAANRTARYRIGGTGRGRPGSLQAKLRRAGLLGNKHIPSEYLRACEFQRLALLQGLMDTDGTVATNRECVFTNTNARIAEGFFELAISLGLKATLRTRTARLRGVDCGPVYSVQFTAPTTFPPFRLKRKLARCAPRHNSRPLSGDRRIVSVDPVESVPVRCIEVAARSHLFLAGRGMIPTGNSGKTPLCAGVGLYMMTADKELSAEVYAAAGKRDQAMRLFDDAVAMYKRSPDLKERILPSGKTRIFKLSHPASNSIFMPISADKQKSGARVHCGLVDELHEHKDRYTVDMLKHGFKGRKQPLEFVITNSGFDRNSICFEWHEHAVAVGNRLRDDDRFFGFVMALDEKDDPLEDEACWEKTNPGIDITITRAYLENQVNDARQIPGRENEVRRLNFCQWTDSDKGWMTRNAWVSIEEVIGEHRDGALIAPDFAGAECYMGLDLSFAFDLSALAFLFPEDDKLVGWIEYFTPRDTAAEREKKDSQPYPLWIKQGLIHACPGKVIRTEHIGARIAEALDLFDVRHIAFDRYRHKDLEDKMAEVGIDAPWIEHPQGFRRGGQLPFPQFRGDDGKAMDNPLWMPQSVDQLEARIIEKTIRIQPSPVTRSHVSAVVIRPDPAGTGNRVFDKRKAVGRIDGIVSLAMADGAAEMKLPKQSLAGFLNRPVMTK